LEILLKKENDFLLLFSPIKYWKLWKLVNKKFIDWYWFNRQHFHAWKSFISCILWQNKNDILEKISLKSYDIEEDKIKNIWKNIEIKKVYTQMQSSYNDKILYNDDEEGVFCETNWSLSYKDTHKKAKYNKNIIGYLRATSHDLDVKSLSLTRLITYDALTQSFGFYLRSDNFVNKLPLFCAKLYPQENWYERDIYFTTADRWEDYLEDKDFLKSCLIFTCLSQRNKCLSFNWSDKRFYKNELCLFQNTQSDEKLKEFNLNNTDKNILKLWNEILEEAMKTKNYNEKFTYWLFQIIQELNTYIYEGKSYTKDELTKLKLTATEKKGKSIEYVVLNTKIEELKKFLKEYYKKEIEAKLFEYELLK